MSGAALIAIGWFLDLCGSVRPSTGSPLYRTRQQDGMTVCRPSRRWQRQFEEVESFARTPTMAHYVRPHVRRYEDRYGTDEARERAPESIRRLLGPRDTWVRGHWRGEAMRGDAVRRSLARASALADLLGLSARAGMVV